MLKCYEILGFMSSTLAHEILEHAHASEKEIYRATLAAVAEARKLRPAFLQRKPRKERHEAMIATLGRPRMEEAASHLLGTWLLKAQTPMLTEFLDGVGIKHKEGVVEELPEAVDDGKLNAAVEALLAKYPQEKVAVYLNAFHTTSEKQWPKLAELLDKDTRLQFA